MPDALTTPEAFISHWQKAEANERANSQSFLIGLAHILGVPLPSNNHADGYSFEFAAYGWEHLWKAHQDASSGSILDFKTGTIAQLDCTPDGFTAAVAAFEKELDAEILTRLVALNAERAAEEKRGIIHWLRPEYQCRERRAGGGETEELLLKTRKATKPKVKGIASPPSALRPKLAKQPWPKPLADRIRATEQALHAAKTPVTATDLTKSFSRAKPHDIQEILESLVTLGRARMEGERFSS